MRGSTVVAHSSAESPAESPVPSPAESPAGSPLVSQRRLERSGLSESPTADVLFAISEHVPFAPNSAEVAARWSSVFGSRPSMSPPPPPPAPPPPRLSSTRRPRGPHPPPPPEPVPLYSATSIWSNQRPPRRFHRDNLIQSVSDTLASVVQEMDHLVSQEEEMDRQDARADNNTHLERVLSRVQRRRTPHLVIRLPTGGYSYAPSRLYSPLHSPVRFQGQQDRPILRQLARTPRHSASFFRVPGRRGRALSTLSLQIPHPPQPAAFFEDNLLPVTLTPEICPRGRCAICLIDFKDSMGKEITWVNCQSFNPTNDHVFCYDCITGWIAHSGRRTCPECRGSF